MSTVKTIIYPMQTQIQVLSNHFFSFLAEISTTESALSYSKLYFGGIERGEIIPSTSPGFIGYISQVFFNGQKFFELSRAGQLDASLKETNNAKKGISSNEINIPNAINVISYHLLS